MSHIPDHMKDYIKNPTPAGAEQVKQIEQRNGWTPLPQQSGEPASTFNDRR